MLPPPATAPSAQPCLLKLATPHSFSLLQARAALYAHTTSFELHRDHSQPLRHPDLLCFSAFNDDGPSPTPSELEIEAQDEAESRKVERYAEDTDSSDSQYDAERPHSL
eukprot:5185973-Pleurochrysis_carterae.AAC.1